MYCPSCGRNNEKEQCIHNLKYGKFDQLFLLLLVTALPAIMYGLYFNVYLDFNLINYMEVGSITISIALIVMLIAYYAFDKLYIVIFFGCHQRIERSFKLMEKPYMLCARCTGIMIGMFISYFIALISFNYFWLLFLCIPLVIDGVIQKRTEYTSNNIKRLVTGLLAGPSIVILFGYLHYLFSGFIIRLTLELI